MQRVFTKLPYLSLAGGVALVVFLSAIWFPNVRLASLFLLDPSISLILAIRLTVGLFISSIGTMSIFSLSYTALAALLIGINSALLVCYIRLYQIAPSLRNVASGVVGSFLALLGFGCVSCGSIFFTTLLVAASGTGFLVAAPYLGIGIGILGIGLLILSAVFLARAINTPPACPI